ncbi:MAG: hypothetical protein H6518_15065 [Microthrixaceae bacterium]|nr:hypothetical protein [Microthrixaceae bacterium]
MNELLMWATPEGNVLALRRRTPAAGLGLGHYFITFFLPATVFFGP